MSPSQPRWLLQAEVSAFVERMAQKHKRKAEEATESRGPKVPKVEAQAGAASVPPKPKTGKAPATVMWQKTSAVEEATSTAMCQFWVLSKQGLRCATRCHVAVLVSFIGGSHSNDSF